MNLFFLHPASRHLRIQSEEHSVVHTQPLQNTNEGSEFLDDAIRVEEDLPPTYTEESVAAGSPRNLL
jgi:hypothetical protein